MKKASLITDGSCLGNPGPGGWACILRFRATKKELFTKPTGQRKREEQQWVQAVTDGHPEVAAAEHLAQGFQQLFKDHDGEGLDAWLQSSQASGIRELKGFVTGIRRDHAGIEQHWSNGQVEGQVHRLKLLKRQMYGRCGFLLLRRRVLPFAVQPQHQPSRSP